MLPEDSKSGDRTGYGAEGGYSASSVFSFAYSDEKAWIVLAYNNEVATSFVKSVFSKSSAGDSGLNVEIPQEGRQRNDSLMQSLKNWTAGKLQCMGGGAAKNFYLGRLSTVALSTACLVIRDSTPPNAILESVEVQQDVSYSLCELAQPRGHLQAAV